MAAKYAMIVAVAVGALLSPLMYVLLGRLTDLLVVAIGKDYTAALLIILTALFALIAAIEVYQVLVIPGARRILSTMWIAGSLSFTTVLAYNGVVGKIDASLKVNAKKTGDDATIDANIKSEAIGDSGNSMMQLLALAIYLFFTALIGVIYSLVEHLAEKRKESGRGLVLYGDVVTARRLR